MTVVGRGLVEGHLPAEDVAHLGLGSGSSVSAGPGRLFVRYPVRGGRLLNYVAFARYAGNTAYDGQVFAIFVIMLAAAEAAIGLAIVLGIYQSFETIDVEATDRLRR